MDRLEALNEVEDNNERGGQIRSLWMQARLEDHLVAFANEILENGVPSAEVDARPADGDTHADR